MRKIEPLFLCLFMAISQQAFAVLRPMNYEVLKATDAQVYPIEITEPGHYIIKDNIILPFSVKGPVIRVSASNVHLDMNGKVISANDTIVAMNGVSNVTVSNGIIIVNGSVAISTTPDKSKTDKNHIFQSLKIQSTQQGIALTGTGHIVKNCEINAASGIVFFGDRNIAENIKYRSLSENAGFGMQFLGRYNLVRGSEFVGAWYAVSIHSTADYNLVSDCIFMNMGGAGYSYGGSKYPHFVRNQFLRVSNNISDYLSEINGNIFLY